MKYNKQKYGVVLDTALHQQSGDDDYFYSRRYVEKNGHAGY